MSASSSTIVLPSAFGSGVQLAMAKRTKNKIVVSFVKRGNIFFSPARSQGHRDPCLTGQGVIIRMRGFAVDEGTDRLIKEIQSDSRSGASEITVKAGECIAAFVDGFKGKRAHEFVTELYALGQRIAAAQPAMAPPFNLVNNVLFAADEAFDLELCQHMVKEKVRGFIDILEGGWKAIAEAARPLVQQNSRILVHSHSATLCRILLALHRGGKQFSVICTESRPLLEGVTLARRLAEAGIAVRLIVDSAAFQVLDHVDLVCVGADTISPHGVTNKIGTRALAITGQCREVPVYAVAGTEKCLPWDVQVHLEAERRPANGILEGPGPIEVLNFYFDRTPLQWISGLITEKGVWNPKELHQYCARLRIHPVLAEWRRKRI